MKIALAQINCHIGNFESNTAGIISNIKQAEKEGVDLIVFPELAICGYPPLDFLDYNHFTYQCNEAINIVAGHCQNIAAIIGTPTINPVAAGKNLFNSACVLQNGKVTDTIHKTLLPTYDVFDEYRYFEPNNTFRLIEVKGKKIALTICEDLWNEEDDPMYVFSPMDKLTAQGPELIINIAASPYDYEQREQRQAILKRNALKYNLPLVYVNHVGAQTDILFDGGSLAMNNKGELTAELKYFEEDYHVVNTDSLNKTSNYNPGKPEKIAHIYAALVMGIRDYFQKMDFKHAVLGLSGGVDSALVLALATEALGKEFVHPVMMPSEFSSDHSVSDSELLAKNLGVETIKIPINGIYHSFLEELRPEFRNKPFNVAEENIQARIRGVIVMALANKHGYILLNTSNKSELAVGYGTLYGDMAGGISVIGDLYKTKVYELCHYINSISGVIPVNILDKAPSAELRPGQKDSDSLPDYDQLDAILEKYIEGQMGYDRIIEMGYDMQLVKRILPMVNRNEYKRFQFAPILRISPKAFGRGRRMPLVAKYLG